MGVHGRGAVSLEGRWIGILLSLSRGQQNHVVGALRLEWIDCGVGDLSGSRVWLLQVHCAMAEAGVVKIVDLAREKAA